MGDAGKSVNGPASGNGAVPGAGPVFDTVGEIRVLSGLTIPDVASILAVEPETLRGWLGGEAPEPSDRIRIDAVLAALRWVGRGSARETAGLLRSPLVGARTGIDLMREGCLAEFVEAAGHGCGSLEPLRVDRSCMPLRGEEAGGWWEAACRAGEPGPRVDATAARGAETRRVPFPQG